MIYIFDCEVFKNDWMFVFKNIGTGERLEFHNDYEGLEEFIERDLILCGFNNKHYDQFILKAVLSKAQPGDIKDLSDFIINGGRGWDYKKIKGLNKYYIPQFDLMDDCQKGLSLKSIEGHLGLDITESTVDFNIRRPLTETEITETFTYCNKDVEATEKLFHLRKNYLNTKLKLGNLAGIKQEDALYMTNAKLTAKYLGAEPHHYTDERDYQYPSNLLREYIPPIVFDFFNRMHDPTITDEELYTSKLQFKIGDCVLTIAYGGIHGAIPCYSEESTNDRIIRNQDVGAYYPHLMVLYDYCSRSIADPYLYPRMVKTRKQAKASGNIDVSNALKLVSNTTYGAMLSKYNPLYDP